MNLNIHIVCTFIILFLSGITDAYLLLSIGSSEFSFNDERYIFLACGLYIISSLFKLLNMAFSCSLASRIAASKVRNLWDELFKSKSYLKSNFNEEEIKTALIICGDRLIFQYYLPLLNLISSSVLMFANISALIIQFGVNTYLFVLAGCAYMFIFRLISRPFIKRNAGNLLKSTQNIDLQISNMYRSTILREFNLDFAWINRKFLKDLKKLENLRWRNGFISLLPKSFLEIFGGFFLILVLLFPGSKITISEILILCLAGIKIIPAFQGLSYNLSAVTDGKVSDQYIKNLILEILAQNEKNNIKSLQKIDGDIKIVEISFVNRGETQSLIIKKGALSVLKGRSGSGKSTFCKYLSSISQSKNIKFPKMEIFINKKLTDKAIFNDYVYYAEQFAPILSGNLMENIGIELKDLDNTKTFNLIKNIFTKNMINLLYTRENIFDRLSGGEIARIGIFRALYSNKKVLIFDEPFSSLDKNSAFELTEILNIYSKRILILIISHQLIEGNINENYLNFNLG